MEGSKAVESESKRTVLFNASKKRPISVIEWGRTRKRGKTQKKRKRSISNEKWGKDVHDDNSIKRDSQLSSWQGLLKRDSENVRIVSFF